MRSKTGVVSPTWGRRGRGPRRASPLTRWASLVAASVGLATVAPTTAWAPARLPQPPAGGPARLAQPPAGAPARLAQAPDIGVSIEPGATGFLSIVVRGPVGATLAVVEVEPTGRPPVPVATVILRQTTVLLRNAVPWSCTDLEPTIEAIEATPYGGVPPAQATTRTPSCAQRLSVAVGPRRLRAGYPAAIQVSDAWGRGDLRVRGCLAGGCLTRTLRAGRPAAFPLRPRFAGRARLTVSDAYEQIDRRVLVRGGRPVLLATGDSEMQVLDDILGTDLAGPGGARVVGDARQSTAITSPSFFDWPAHAGQQVASLHPDVVAMFLGGNEGFAIGGAACCGPAWSRRYAGLVASMMSVYRQGGAADVYWFLIPTPSAPAFVSLVHAVDLGISLAAGRFATGVHVFDLRPVFSPAGRYIDSLAYRGQTIVVHESDGFHLSGAADVILARLFAGRLRDDGVL